MIERAGGGTTPGGARGRKRDQGERVVSERRRRRAADGEEHGTGFVVPVVTTSPLQPVTLVAGTQSITMQAFHTTNAVCYAANDRPAMSTSLDIEIKTLASFGATPFFGKKFPATFALRCR